MQTRIDRKNALYSFRSLRELSEYIRDTPKTWKYRESETEASQSWDLGAGYAACERMAHKGWQEGAQRAATALKAFAPTQPAARTRHDFYGYRPNVALYCAGEPMHMVRKATKGAPRVLTLIVPVNASAGTGAQSMANYGLGVAQYVNQMELSGTRVELIGVIVSEVSGMRVAHSFTVKQASQPMDLAVVSFAMGHPGMFRRLGFALRERSAAKANPGYGQSVRAVASDVINAPAGAIVLNGMRDAETYARTPADALAHITREIEIAQKGL